jgi:3-keto-disaccharide hydrolase
MNFKTLFITVSATALLALAPKTPGAELEWQSLHPDRSLKGWSVRGGKAPFTVAGQEIVGRSVLGSPNSFLITDATYSDFILEYDAKVDPRLNSGVMVRAEHRPDYRGGVVFGYQVEIDSSARAWSGGIYDEQRREWLNTLARNAQARAAFKVGEWNHFRVEALGNRIRTFVNGVAAANLIDDMTPRGFIGLQVHSVDEGPKLAGLEARFRNIRIVTQDAAAAATPLDPAADEYNYIPNQLTQVQVAQGWRLLWDGTSTSGWHGATLSGFPDHGWTIRDGVLSVDAAAGGESTNGGDIITREEFANFELELDFRITPGANSGIKYFVDPQLGPTLGLTGSAIGLEFQILDDERHPDAKLGVRGNRTVGSLYDLIPATNLDEPGRTAKRVLPPGAWNRARIVATGRHVEHWLNGVKVVEYDRGTQMFRALVNNSKYKDMPGFGEREHGPILLQDHGNAVSFRSIKIRSL